MARASMTSNLPPEELKTRIRQLEHTNSNGKHMKLPIEEGYEIAGQYDANSLTLMFDSLQVELMQFHQSPAFPEIFTDMVRYAHGIFQLNLNVINPKEKQKSLHTDELVGEEVLTEFEKLQCIAFQFLSEILTKAAESPNVDLKKIDKSIIEMIFFFMNHNHPNSVRANAGNIISALSAIPEQCKVIIEYFWTSFAACKKDDDFRNFASWIDGVVNIKLSFESQKMNELTIKFLKEFISHSKKIERGVLRMKFLDCIKNIAERSCKSSNAASIPEFDQLIRQIYDIVVKWSSKSKHTTFCYQFIEEFLHVLYPSFFISGLGVKFGEMLCKAAKGGDIELLTLLTKFIKDCPDEFTTSHVDVFTKMFTGTIVPILFSGNEKKRCPRFKEPQQVESIINIFVETGLRNMGTIVDFIRTTLNAEKPNDDMKRTRLICITSLGIIAEKSPSALSTFNNELFPPIEAILLQTSPGFADEMQHAIKTFPLIHSSNETKLAQISQILFDFSIGSNQVTSELAFKSLTNFIATLVTLTANTLLPLTYLDKLFENLLSFPDADIIKRLSLIKGIAAALAESLSSQQSNLKTVMQGTSAMTMSDWKNFRLKLDKIILPLILSTSQDVSKAAIEVEKVFQEEAIEQLDITCNVGTPYYLSKWLHELPEKTDYVSQSHLLIEKNKDTAQVYFQGLFEYWKNNRSNIGPQKSQKILSFVSSIAYHSDQTLKLFFEELFKLYREDSSSLEVPHALTLLHPSLWVQLIIDLNQWMGTSGLTTSTFWAQYVNIFYTFSNRPEFAKEIVEQPKLAETYERFIISFWKGNAKSCKPSEMFILTEKSFKVLRAYAEFSTDKLTRIVEQTTEGFNAFINALENMVNISDSSSFTETYIETFLTTLKAIFAYLKFPDQTSYIKFAEWLTALGIHSKTKEQITILNAQLITTILQHNKSLLRNVFRNTFIDCGQVSSAFILAIGNVFQSNENFLTEYENAAPVLLATIILHIKSHILVSRQAAFKLMCLTFSRPEGIFTSEIPVELLMSVTSESASGFHLQAQHFFDFSCSHITSKSAFEVFKIFSKDCSLFLQSHSTIISSLNHFVRIMVTEHTLSDVVPVLLNLTTGSRIEDPDVATEIHLLWSTFFATFKEFYNDQVKELIQLIFRFGVEQEHLTSKESNVSVLILVDEFSIFPEETASFLIPFLCKYERKVPEEINEFGPYLSCSDITFSITSEEIIAYNAISQILFLVNDHEQFNSLFLDKLAPLTFYAVMMYHIDAFRIGLFHPLLDSLLDAILFRQASTNEVFTSNIEKLQDANLIKRAISLVPQDSMFTEIPTKQMLCYDSRAISTLSTLLVQADPNFKTKFFDIVVGNAFQVAICERAVDPFLMIMGLIDIFTTKFVFELLLYTLFAFKTGRTELMDSIIDNINQRLMTPNLPEDVFATEALPVIIVFILLLALDFKRSFSIHLMKIISDVAEKICGMKCAESISAGLIVFMRNFNGDEYIASLFSRFIEDVQTFSDQSVIEIIRALYALSRLIGAGSEENNWCTLFAFLIDGTRYFLSTTNASYHIEKVIKSPEYKTIPEFIQHIVDNYTLEKHCIFAINFFCAFFKTFKCNDHHSDTIALQMINEFLRRNETKLSPSFTDTLIKLLFIVSLSGDGVGRAAACAAQNYIISNIQHRLDQSAISLTIIQPKFITIKKKIFGSYRTVDKTIVDPTLLPTIKLFSFSGLEMNAIFDTLWQFLSSKISPTGERVPMPIFKNEAEIAEEELAKTRMQQRREQTRKLSVIEDSPQEQTLQEQTPQEQTPQEQAPQEQPPQEEAEKPNETEETQENAEE